MYLKEIVALSLSFPHFRVNILTVNSQLSVTGRTFELLKRTHIAKAIKATFVVHFSGALIEANRSK